MGGEQRVVLLRLADALKNRQVARGLTRDEIDVLPIETDHRIHRGRAGKGAERRDVVGRGPRRLSLARGVTDVRAEEPPAAGEGAGSAVAVAAVNADAEARVVASVLRVEVVTL